MRSSVFSRCVLPCGIVVLLSTSLSVATSPAYGEHQGAVSHKSSHHTHHHGKKGRHAHRVKHGVARKKKTSTRHRHPVHPKKHNSVTKAATASAGVAAGSVVAHDKETTAQANNPSQPPTLMDDHKGSETGLPLPRFVSLRADRVYMRRGPGERYPIDWVYHRRGYPVKIEREFGVWRLVEDPDGQKGWVHQVTLRGGRSFVIPGASSPAGDGTKLPTTQHADPRIVAYVSEQEALRGQNHDVPLMDSQDARQKPIAVLEPGTVGAIKACPKESTWCHVTVRGYDGWLDRQSLWGVQPGEIIQPD